MYICVVTVTYGDRSAFLKEVVAALSGIQASNRITHLLIVDNGSSEATRAYLCKLKQHNPRAKVIRFAENRGSAAGFRAGLEAALEADCDYIWLLDDDNKPEPTALSALIEAAKAQGEAAFLSLRTDRPPYIRYAETGNWAACFGQPNSFLGFSWRDIPQRVTRHIRPEAPPARPQPRIVPYAPYGGLFLSKTRLRKIGLPREDFYLYADDFEFTHRLTKAGIPITLIPESVLIDIDAAWHTRSGQKRDYFLSPFILTSPQADKLKRLYYSFRNGVYFETTSLGVNPFEYRLNGFLHLFMLGLMALSGAVSRFSTTPLRSYYTLLEAARDGFRGKLGRRYRDGQSL